MVASLLHPLNIFILGLGGGFVIPLLSQIGKTWVSAASLVVLAGMTLIAGISLLGLKDGAPPIEILTGGFAPPLAINLRFGPTEGLVCLCVDLIALLGAWQFVRAKYSVALLYVMLVMGIQGLVMTRDLFNLFVFLEIVSIATYGLLSLQPSSAALAASFKYIMATVVASGFFLLGTVLLYYVTGVLNIDQLLELRTSIASPIGFAALLFVLACLLIELKPFPANGWGLDVYETAPSGIAALISVGVSAGVFFALWKLLPLFENQLTIIAASGALTFLFSNLLALKQTKAQRLLGYSSIGQMGLLTLALALLKQQGSTSTTFVVGCLFVNHLFAKSGLFWLAGFIDKERIEDWPAMAGRPLLILMFAILLTAIAGFPPFPGFWAKWQLVMQLATRERHIWIAVILLGSLLEAAYLFQWFGRVLRSSEQDSVSGIGFPALAPVALATLLLAAGGYLSATLAGVSSIWILAPLCAGILLYLLDGLPGRIKCVLMLAVVLCVGTWLVRNSTGLGYLFSALLLAGGLVVATGCFYRTDARPGFYPLLAVLLLSLPALSHSSTSLEFFFTWELITLSSYFLILQGREAIPHALRYLLFSLVSAFFLLAGFAAAYAANGSIALEALRIAGPGVNTAFVLLAIGFLIKAAACGVHVWLPGAYAEADDDLTAILSAVVSKAPIFGLLVCTYVAIRSEGGLELARAMAWVGLLTTIAGAVMALREDDIKRMLAYSSMSQLGYIVTAIALMSHLGWVTALYLVANHLMVKGILFLATAGIILRTGSRLIVHTGGLARNMPITFATILVAIVAMSGLPPLTGFGGKWLLLSAMMEKGWYLLALGGVLATFVGFLYMFRFVNVIFLGERRTAYAELREEPVSLLVPQFCLIAGIIVLSFFPKLLIEPVSAAIDPIFASTLVWEGMSLETIYGFWNPVPVMVAAVAASVLLFAIFWLVHRNRWQGDSDAGATHHELRRAAHLKKLGLYSFYKPVLSALVTPFATMFWDGVSSGTVALAGFTRKLYTGNGQYYILVILYYVIVLFLVGGVFGETGAGR